MARGRLISRTLGSSRKFAALHKQAGRLGEFAQSLYPMLIANSDDFGRLSGDAFTVKHAVFPTSPRREDEFAAAITAMHHVGLIQWYETDDGQVIQIYKFKENQPGLHQGIRSRFPESPVTSADFTETRESPSEEKGREEKRTEGKRTALTRKTDPVSFETFWMAYPRKKSRSTAEKVWRTLAPSPELLQQILDAIAAQRNSPQWIEQRGKFIPYPSTWLNQKRWEDEADCAGQPAAAGDWWEECKSVHGGQCVKRWDHEMKMREAS